jgi:hypothetical protein
MTGHQTIDEGVINPQIGTLDSSSTSIFIEYPLQYYSPGGTIIKQPQLQQMTLRGGFVEFIDRENIENPCLRCLLCGCCRC